MALLAALGGLLVLPSAAGAVSLGKPADGQLLAGSVLNVRNDFYLKVNTFLDENPDDDLEPDFPFVEVVNRLTADLKIKRFSFGGQLDVVGIGPSCLEPWHRERFAERFGADQPCASPNPLYGNGWQDDRFDNVFVRLEKVWLRYRSPNLDVSLGDYYVALGRGILLSMVRKPEIDQDNSLLGGRVDVRTKPLDISAFVGVPNPQEVSMELRNRLVNKVDLTLLAGGVVKLRPASGVELALQGVGYDLTTSPKGALGATAGINGIGGAVDLFAEADWFLYPAGADVLLDQVIPSEAAGLDGWGYAVYGAGTAYAGPLTLLLELKRYRGSQAFSRPGPITPLQYYAAPSLEVDTAITEDVFGTVQSNDITGWKATGELFFLKTNTTLTLALGNAFDAQPHPGFSPQREISLHPFVALDQPVHLGKADLHVRGHLGYRHDFPWRLDVDALPADQREDKEAEYLPHVGLLHFYVDVGLTVGIHSIEWVTYYRRHAVTLEEDFCWTEEGEQVCSGNTGWIAMENALSYTLMGKYTAALHLDFTDDPIVQSTQNDGAPGNLHYDHDFRSSWYIGGSVIVKPVSNVEVSAFFGGQKSGVVCTGGACRTVPSFTGFKTRVTVNF